MARVSKENPEVLNLDTAVANSLAACMRGQKNV